MAGGKKTINRRENMAFKAKRIQQILQQAEQMAERLGLEDYLIVIKRGDTLRTISSEEELQPGDEFVSVSADAKVG